MLGGKILSNGKGHFDPTGRTSQSGPPLKGGPPPVAKLFGQTFIRL